MTFNISLLIIVWILHSLKIIMWNKVELEFSIILVFSFVSSALGPELLKDKYHDTIKPKILIPLACLSFSALIFISISKTWFKTNVIINSPYLTGLLYGIFLGVIVGVIARRLIIPTVKLFNYIADYIKVISLPMAAFFCGYIIIFLIFGGMYALIDQLDKSAFDGKYTWSLGEFIVYSIASITTLGDTQIYANNNLTRWLTSLEVFLGVIWTTVVLASTIGFVQKDFDKIKKGSTIQIKIKQREGKKK